MIQYCTEAAFMKVIILVVILLITIRVCSSFLENRDIQPKVMTPVGMIECDEKSKIEKTILKDTKGTDYTLYWTENAASTCPGPFFPRIVLEHPSVQFWVQIVHSNASYESLNGSTDGWMGQLPSDDDELVWLDIPKDHRAKKKPFYNSTPQGVFHDNPSWGFLPEGSSLKRMFWRASLYGFPTDSITEQPLVQLEWGFDLISGKNFAIPFDPKNTDTKMLEVYLDEAEKSP